MKILNFYGRLGYAYLHSGSIGATSNLFNWMNPNKGDTILDFGCGTGSSLIVLKSQFPYCIPTGCDKNPRMLKTAAARLKHVKMDSEIALMNSAMLSKTEFENHFNQIYVESVLAFQDLEQLEYIFRLFRKILKPKGRLLINETIWNKSTSKAIMREVNKLNLTQYGIIQCNEEISYLEDWKDFFQRNGFELEKSFKNDQNRHSQTKHNLVQLSENFSRKSKYLQLLNPFNLFYFIRTKMYSKNFNRKYKNILEGYTFKLRLSDKSI